MRDPSYIRDHPQLGVAAKQRIYRFANEKGAVVNWLYRTSQWELFPVAVYRHRSNIVHCDRCQREPR